MFRSFKSHQFHFMAYMEYSWHYDIPIQSSKLILIEKSKIIYFFLINQILIRIMSVHKMSSCYYSMH